MVQIPNYCYRCGNKVTTFVMMYKYGSKYQFFRPLLWSWTTPWSTLSFSLTQPPGSFSHPNLKEKLWVSLYHLFYSGGGNHMWLDAPPTTSFKFNTRHLSRNSTKTQKRQGSCEKIEFPSMDNSKQGQWPSSLGPKECWCYTSFQLSYFLNISD